MQPVGSPCADEEPEEHYLPCTRHLGTTRNTALLTTLHRSYGNPVRSLSEYVYRHRKEYVCIYIYTHMHTMCMYDLCDFVDNITELSGFNAHHLASSNYKAKPTQHILIISTQGSPIACCNNVHVFRGLLRRITHH